jgi:hypothetical protein
MQKETVRINQASEKKTIYLPISKLPQFWDILPRFGILANLKTKIIIILGG